MSTTATATDTATMDNPHHWTQAPLWALGSIGLSGAAAKLAEHGMTLQGVASCIAAVGTALMAANALLKTLQPNVDRVLTLVEQRWGRPK